MTVAGRICDFHGAFFDQAVHFMPGQFFALSGNSGRGDYEQGKQDCFHMIVICFSLVLWSPHFLIVFFGVLMHVRGLQVCF